MMLSPVTYTSICLPVSLYGTEQRCRLAARRLARSIVASDSPADTFSSIELRSCDFVSEVVMIDAAVGSQRSVFAPVKSPEDSAWRLNLFADALAQSYAQFVERSKGDSTEPDARLRNRLLDDMLSQGMKRGWFVLATLGFPCQLFWMPMWRNPASVSAVASEYLRSYMRWLPIVQGLSRLLATRYTGINTSQPASAIWASSIMATARFALPTARLSSPEALDGDVLRLLIEAGVPIPRKADPQDE